MPGSYNKLILVGNVTRDPEVRTTQSGSSVVKISLAVNHRLKTGDNEVTYVDCTAWEKMAETCGKYVKKGMSILVEGRLAIRSYEDKDGNKRKSTECVFTQMQMLDKKSDDGSQRSAGQPSSTGGGQAYSQDEEEINEIPF